MSVYKLTSGTDGSDSLCQEIRGENSEKLSSLLDKVFYIIKGSVMDDRRILQGI